MSITDCCGGYARAFSLPAGALAKEGVGPKGEMYMKIKTKNYSIRGRAHLRWRDLTSKKDLVIINKGKYEN